MTGNELRQAFLTFCRERGHTILPSVSLVPENDQSVLFTSAGMQSFIPNFMGEPHPGGRRLADVQKCLRTDDIEEVGDISHLTFFEMLGFWSLGDYWKQESLCWTLQWFTEVLGLEQERISVTIFAGDDDAPRDNEAEQVWLSLDIPQERIYALQKEDNWWELIGQPGPCGPDSELFYDTGRSAHGPDCRPGCHCGKYIEIGNNVFLQYNKTAEGRYEPLQQPSIDVGLGLERILCVLQGTEDVYTTDLFAPIVDRISLLLRQSSVKEQRVQRIPEQEQRLVRIIADHVRAATFMLADGVVPSNAGRGYICRRLLRRAIRYAQELRIPTGFLPELGQIVVASYSHAYPELEQRQESILSELAHEEERFGRTLVRGLREFHRREEQLQREGGTVLSGETVFHLFDTSGFPPSLTAELAREHGLSVDMEGFERLYRQHQERSRVANQEKFKRIF